MCKIRHFLFIVFTFQTMRKDDNGAALHACIYHTVHSVQMDNTKWLETKRAREESPLF